MADFPNSVFTPRVVQNLPGKTYDPAKTVAMYAEDLNFPNAEIVAIEQYLISGEALFDRIICENNEILIEDNSVIFA